MKQIFTILWALISVNAFSQPIISTVSPMSGNIGTQVTISGQNFNPIAANNVVFFGSTSATVTYATPTILKVRVPKGATNNYISVTDTTTGLTAYSLTRFVVTFDCGSAIDLTAFAPKVNYSAGTYPNGVAIGDLDGDGKTDIVASNDGGGLGTTVSIYRNTSTTGTVTFASKVDYTTGTAPFGVAVGDINGDGKLDVITANRGAASVSILKNTASPGAFAFDAKVDFTTGSNPYSVSVNDMDQDGKPDLVVANYGANTVSVLRNTSTITTISFDAKVDFPANTNPWGITTGDLDGDAKPDIAVANYYGDNVSIIRNTSTIGNITCDPKVDYPTGDESFYTTFGDLDGDGKEDVMVVNGTAKTVSIFRNISTPGTISLDAKTDYALGQDPRGVCVSDVNGDGQLDVVVAIASLSTVSVFENTSVTGTISLGTNFDFSAGTNPICLSLGDFDGDGRPDIVTQNFTASISVLRNAISGTPQINGVVSYSGGFVGQGDAKVFLYKNGTNGNHYLADSVLMGANGTYSFQNISVGDYYVYVKLNNHNAPYQQVHNSYYDSTYKWQDAQIINLTCGTNSSITHSMFEIVPPGIGNCHLRGSVKMMSTGGTKALGEPVEGAEIFVEQEPTDAPIVNTTTDISGLFEVFNIPVGVYTIYVDIPGFPLIETYTDITISSTDTLFEDLNFYVDTNTVSAGIYTSDISSVKLIENNAFKVDIYPNPVVTETYIEYTLSKPGKLTIELIDLSGRKVVLEKSELAKGTYTKNVSTESLGLSKGLFILKFSFENNVYVKRIVIQ